MLPSIIFSQSTKLKWGLSTPIMTTDGSKELALSRTVNNNYMFLLWGKLYFDKNTGSSPNHRLYKNMLYGIETELRRSIYKNNKVTPYFGIFTTLNNENRYNRYYNFFSESNEFVEATVKTKQVGMGFSFGAEYFITPAISILVHSRIFYIYYSWHNDAGDETLLRRYYSFVDDKQTSFNTKGFERSTLYIRFYF